MIAKLVGELFHLVGEGGLLYVGTAGSRTLHTSGWVVKLLGQVRSED